MQVEVMCGGVVEVRLFDGRADPTYVLTLDAGSDAKADQLAALIRDCHIHVEECQL